MANVINGGAHSDAPIDFQEFMIMPLGLPTFSEGLRAIIETFHALKSVLKKKGCSTAVGDEGGFAPKLGSVEEALETIIQAIKDAGYKPGKDIYLTLDPAASEFYSGNAKYTFKKSTGETVSGDDLVAFYAKLVAKYPIVCIEDGCARRATGRRGKNSPTNSATKFNSSATTFSSPIRNSCTKALTPARPIRFSSK